MSWVSHALGLDRTPHTSVDKTMQSATTQAGANATDDRNRYLDILGGGQDALNTSIRSAMSAAMPSFMHQIQGINEDSVRRGISTGDLGTSYEGDAASAFQRNIANAAGSEAMNLYGTNVNAAGSLYNQDTNRYLGLLGGQQQYEQEQQAYKRQKSSNLFGGLGAAIGSIWGPTGAAIGGSIGSGIGG